MCARAGGTRWLGAARRGAADAACVAALRACGAVLAGKANMHELGAGTSGINPHHGSTRNPHDPGRVAGGSSGGSAAAVCAGLCPVALGADGGGKMISRRRRGSSAQPPRHVQSLSLSWMLTLSPSRPPRVRAHAGGALRRRRVQAHRRPPLQRRVRIHDPSSEADQPLSRQNSPCQHCFRLLPLNWTVGMPGILAATVEDALIASVPHLLTNYS